jgi:hypothetical protein
MVVVVGLVEELGKVAFSLGLEGSVAVHLGQGTKTWSMQAEELRERTSEKSCVVAAMSPGCRVARNR